MNRWKSVPSHIILSAALALLAPSTASAQVAVINEELRRGSGSEYRSAFEPPVSRPTTWETGPFPDDDRNAITMDAAGALNVKFNIRGPAHHELHPLRSA